jgi:hypothetical protein
VRARIRDIEHFIRAAILFGIGLTVFLVARELLIPKDFGALGHYRPGALADNAARPVGYAGRAVCEECHQEIVDLRKGSKHEKVACEACHGALAAHAEDPASVKPALPDARTLCLVCHDRLIGRPASFPQVDAQEHAGDEACNSCHRPHHPEVE